MYSDNHTEFSIIGLLIFFCLVVIVFWLFHTYREIVNISYCSPGQRVVTYDDGQMCGQVYRERWDDWRDTVCWDKAKPAALTCKGSDNGKI